MFIVLLLAALTVAQESSPSATVAATQLPPKVTLNCSGASFPALLITLWGEMFANATQGTVTYDYQAVGSGAGVRAFAANENDFSCSDRPLTAQQYSDITSQDRSILHLPETVGGIVVVANLPGAGVQNLVLTPQLIALIFTGRITRWNDPRLLAVNGNNFGSLARVDERIVVVRRADSSGTTFAFTEFLTVANAEFDEPAWDTGASSLPDYFDGALAGDGNSGVGQILLSTSFSIAYLEFGQARELASTVEGRSLVLAEILDASCIFTEASFVTISSAPASAFFTVPSARSLWEGVSLHYIAGGEIWPATTFTYMLVNLDQRGRGAQGAALKAFLRWCMTEEAQSAAVETGLVPVAERVASLNTEAIETMLVDDDELVERYYSLIDAPIVVRSSPASGGPRNSIVYRLVAGAVALGRSLFAAACARAGDFQTCGFAGVDNDDGGDSTMPAAATTQRVTVRVALYEVATSAQFAPLWAAQRLGMFDEQCIDIEWYASVASNGPRDVQRRTRQGEYDIAITTMPRLLDDAASSDELAALLSLSSRSTWQLIAHRADLRPDVGVDPDLPPRQALAALKSVLHGRDQPGQAFFKAYDLAPGSSFTYASAGSGAVVVDRFVSTESAVSAMEARPHVELANLLTLPRNPENVTEGLYTLDDFVVFDFNDVDAGVPEDIVVANREWATENVDVVERFLAGLMKAVVFCSKNRAHSCASALPPRPRAERLRSRLAVDLYLRNLFDGVAPIGAPSNETIERVARNNAEYNLDAPDVDQAVDRTLFSNLSTILANAGTRANIRASDLEAFEFDGVQPTYVYFDLPSGGLAAPAGSFFDETDFSVRARRQNQVIILRPDGPDRIAGMAPGAFIALLTVLLILICLAIIGLIVFMSMRQRRRFREEQEEMRKRNDELARRAEMSDKAAGDALDVVLRAFRSSSSDERALMMTFEEREEWTPLLVQENVTMSLPEQASIEIASLSKKLAECEPIAMDSCDLKVGTERLTFGLGAMGGRLVRATVGMPIEQKFEIKNESTRTLPWCIVSPPVNFLYSLHFSPAHGKLSKGAKTEITATLIPHATKNIRTAVTIALPSVSQYVSLKVLVDVAMGRLLDPNELDLAFKPVSAGSAGDVYEAQWRGQSVAVKLFKNQSALRKGMLKRKPDPASLWSEFMLEVSMLTRLRHKKIVNILGVCIVPGHCSIVTEWLPLGTAYRAVRLYNVNPGLKTRISIDLAEALAYLHDNDLLHRDVKPSNVLIESLAGSVTTNAKLADFGSSREQSAKEILALPELNSSGKIKKKNFTQGVGTPVYMAPEVLTGEEQYSAAADVYSFGSCLYTFFLETTPWREIQSAKELAKLVTNGKRPKLPKGKLASLPDAEHETAVMPRAVRKLVLQAWEADPAERPSMRDLLEDLAIALDDGVIEAPITATPRDGVALLPLSKLTGDRSTSRRSIADSTNDPSSEQSMFKRAAELLQQAEGADLLRTARAAELLANKENYVQPNEAAELMKTGGAAELLLSDRGQYENRNVDDDDDDDDDDLPAYVVKKSQPQSASRASSSKRVKSRSKKRKARK